MANFSSSFEDFVVNQPIQVDVTSLIIALLLSAFFSYLLGKLYVKYGTALSNRKRFAGNFVLLTTTTTLVISIVKSSLALSLGLVGALSIVRFRAAIKEPEELVFLFLAIGIGLGFGANQFLTTTVSFVIISLIILFTYKTNKKSENQNLYLTVSGKSSKNLNLKNIVDVLSKHSHSILVKRFDQKDGTIEASFLIDLESFQTLEKVRDELNKLSDKISITYLDKSGIN